MEDVNIYLNENSNLYIGKNTVIDRKSTININSSTFIGRNCLIKEGFN